MNSHRLSRWRPARTRIRPPGTSPGTIDIPAEAQAPRLNVIAYGPAGDPIERQDVRVRDLAALRRELESLGAPATFWLDVQGLGDEDTLLALADEFHLHRLALEDVVSLGQRAKTEVYDDHLFVVLRMPHGGHVEQVSLFLGRDFVLTFQEQTGDCFDAVRERIRHGRGRIRQGGADYLAYALIDAVIDSFFPVLDELGERLAAIEQWIIGGDEESDREVGEQIHQVRGELLSLRRAIWPHRDAVQTLAREAGDFVTAETGIYLRDAHDHAVSIIELLEAYRELTSDLMSLHQAQVSNRMNEVMKVLTVIATIFIPLTFIAGIYGMNFDRAASPWNMPELGWRFGYPFSLAMMVAVALVMVWYFARKGWFR